ncbi:MAG: XRE family transcriptional regulator [Thalassobaculales bacterium]
MPAADVNARIASRVRQLRAARGLALEALAAVSGVSRSTISLIERGETSPTAVVLERLAGGLGVTLAALFDTPAAGAGPLARRGQQVEWQDPQSGYRRRNVTPEGYPAPFQIVEVEFPPGARVGFENAGRAPPPHQQVWVLAGTIEVASGQERHLLEAGDCLAMELDRPNAFHNPTAEPARYAVIIATPPGAR